MIAVVGLSHKTAPIDVRERLALSPELGEKLLGELVHRPEINEAFVISTCNRVEIVAACESGELAELQHAVAAARQVIGQFASGVDAHLYAYVGEPALLHLFRVASSLDSLVMGEPQILGQVKAAYELGRKQGTVSVHLNRAVSHALRTAKRVRTETTLGAGQVSVPSVAVDLAKQIFGDLTAHRVLLIGSGQMGETAAKLLLAAGASVAVMGRNPERVGELARELGGQALGLDALPEQLASVDVIVTATSSPHYVVSREQVAAVRKRRRGRSLFLIDLAVPRDVDPGVDQLDGVFLYNVDDLSQIVAETLSSRQREAESAEEIVVSETRNYLRALSAEQATPTIVALRRQLRGIFDSELDKSLRAKLKHLPAEDRESLERMIDSALNKMLHPAMRHLRGLATSPDSQAELDACVTMLVDLFALDVTPSLRAGATGSAQQKPVPAPAPTAQANAAPSSDDDRRGELRVSNPVLSDKLG